MATHKRNQLQGLHPGVLRKDPVDAKSASEEQAFGEEGKGSVSRSASHDRWIRKALLWTSWSSWIQVTSGMTLA